MKNKTEILNINNTLKRNFEIKNNEINNMDDLKSAWKLVLLFLDNTIVINNETKTFKTMLIDECWVFGSIKNKLKYYYSKEKRETFLSYLKTENIGNSLIIFINEVKDIIDKSILFNTWKIDMDQDLKNLILKSLKERWEFLINLCAGDVIIKIDNWKKKITIIEKEK